MTPFRMRCILLNMNTPTCAYCGVTLDKPFNYRTGPPYYCGQRCMQRVIKGTQTVACANCGKPLDRHQARLRRSEHHFCDMRCHGAWQSQHKTGKANPAYKTGHHQDPRTGYYYVGGRLEHRVIMEAHLGRTLETWEHVHHKNHDRSDNRLENLEVKPAPEHARYHALTRHWGPRGKKPGWSTKGFTKCVECDSDQYPHKSHGRCSRCYEAQRPYRPDRRVNRQPIPWGQGNMPPACVFCGQTDQPPAAKGKCRRCYGREKARKMRAAKRAAQL